MVYYCQTAQLFGLRILLPRRWVACHVITGCMVAVQQCPTHEPFWLTFPIWRNAHSISESRSSRHILVLDSAMLPSLVSLASTAIRRCPKILWAPRRVAQLLNIFTKHRIAYSGSHIPTQRWQRAVSTVSWSRAVNNPIWLWHKRECQDLGGRCKGRVSTRHACNRRPLNWFPRDVCNRGPFACNCCETLL